MFFCFQAEDGIRDLTVTGVQTCALPISQVRLLKRIQPDLCVATHFLPAEIIAWLIAKRKLRAHNAIVVTDYDVHAMWLCRTVDRYYVAIEEAAEYLARIGVPREKLRVTGIPIDPLFAA